MAPGAFGDLKLVDAFGKTVEDVKVKTKTGAFLTIISAAIILTFSMIEFIDYRSVFVDTSMVVDRSRGERLTINFNMTFPRVPCYLLSLDIMDVSGEQQRDIAEAVVKIRLDESGQRINTPVITHRQNDLDKVLEQKDALLSGGYCGSCYGGAVPEGGCCQTCEDVRNAYATSGWSFNDPDAIEQCVREGWGSKLKEQSSEGCNIYGKLWVNKVIGTLHLSFGRSFHMDYMNMHQFVPYLRDEENKHDWSHRIHEFGFESEDNTWYGVEITEELEKLLGEKTNPLDGTYARSTGPNYMYRYFLKVVSNRFHTLKGQSFTAHQFSATHFERDLTKENTPSAQISYTTTGVPGVFFSYEISPLLVVQTESRQSFAHFLTSSVAIIGGVLTVASIIDRALFAWRRALKNQPQAEGPTSAYTGKYI
ncbi:endoplasmic reticulum-derived transport vesicle ERV46 [Rickenella mellea]|uniref:Endoplasmic reticulum-derived transport vesicle ERV46 n=1 Tax=Rickenella mellea TaxID=50990 RepID=A0A4Y7Q3E2_9AGAM|nr:endoplasmic reticulum-derived transport vesicle ERV46 [Rickenella mellea]